MSPLEESLYTLGVLSQVMLTERGPGIPLDEDSARLRGYLQTLEVLVDGSYPGLSAEALPLFRRLVEVTGHLVPEVE